MASASTLPWRAISKRQSDSCHANVSWPVLVPSLEGDFKAARVCCAAAARNGLHQQQHQQHERRRKPSQTLRCRGGIVQVLGRVSAGLGLLAFAGVIAIFCAMVTSDFGAEEALVISFVILVSVVPVGEGMGGREPSLLRSQPV